MCAELGLLASMSLHGIKPVAFPNNKATDQPSSNNKPGPSSNVLPNNDRQQQQQQQLPLGQ
jgi:hypothetical protein